MDGRLTRRPATLTASPFGRVTGSAGVAAVVPGRDGLGLQFLADAADQALYAAKLTGRDCVAAPPTETMADACA